MERLLNITNIGWVLDHIEMRKDPGIVIDNKLVKFSEIRLLTYVRSGISCVICGLKGTYFAVDRDNGGKKELHLNLYGIRDTNEIMITSDHILPKSKGGSNSVMNRQTMCVTCNSAKGNKSNEEFLKLVHRQGVPTKTENKGRKKQALNNRRQRVIKEKYRPEFSLLPAGIMVYNSSKEIVLGPFPNKKIAFEHFDRVSREIMAKDTELLSIDSELLLLLGR